MTKRKPRSHTIPACLHDAVIAKLRELNPDTRRQYNCQEVARWLAAEHGCQASDRAVYRLRVAVEGHSDEQIAAAIREELRDVIIPAKRVLAHTLKRLNGLVDTSSSVRDLSAGLGAVARSLSTLADITGVTAPKQINVSGRDEVELEWPDTPAPAPAEDPPPEPPPAAE